MKRISISLFCILAIIFGAFVPLSAQEKTLPGSLDDLYPPKAQAPIYLGRMFELSAPFIGIVVDLQEQDFPNVGKDFQAFLSLYQEIAKLVPEWEKEYPLAPVVELGTALGMGDQGKVMAAYGAVSQVCTNCHHSYMVDVQQKYHWGNVNDIKVKDPLTNQELGYVKFKQYMDASYIGIGLSLQQGQPDNAKMHFQGFKARFKTLKGTCSNCHLDPKEYLKYGDMKALIDQLEQALGRTSIDPKEVAGLSQEIGMESCFKCHLVHVPAAMSHK